MNRALESLSIIKQFLKNDRLYWYYEQELHNIEEELIKKDKLDEELGCPLEILFKLVNQNELYYQFYNELQH